VFFLLSGLLAANATAKTYYVNGRGKDDNRGTSSKRAFRTIKKAAEVARSGDTVKVGAGKYNDSFQIVGQQRRRRRLEFRAESPGSVTIGGQVEVFNSNRVVFKGFHFAGSIERFIVWHGSYNGLFENCTFSQGRQGLLVKDGSLTMDHCEIADFTNHGIQVDGAAQLSIQNSRISGCGRAGLEIRKDSRIKIDNSNIVDNVGNGLHVAFTDETIPVSAPSCDCLGTSPHVLAQQSYDLLATVKPKYAKFRSLIKKARTDINKSLEGKLWEDEWHAKTTKGSEIYERSLAAIEKLNAVYTNDVEFVINGDEVIVDHPFTIDTKVLGAAISAGGLYDLPVTTNIRVGNKTYQPFGSFSSPTKGNVNDNRNPRSFESSDVHEKSTKVSVAGRSWAKRSYRYSGSKDSHFYSYMTVQSTSRSGNLVVLRDGDRVPKISGVNGQASAEAFLKPYISGGGKVKLADNQVIFLFELGTTNLNSSAADFQDLVVLLTLKRAAESTEITAEEAELIRQAMKLLVKANEALASCAINQASCAGGDEDIIAEALQYHSNGLSKAGNEQFADASKSYRVAWEAAQKALKNRSSSVAGNGSSQANPPSGWKIDRLTVSVSDSKFTGNASGVAMLTKHEFTANDTDFSRNKNWGLQLRGTVAMKNCTITRNTGGGLHLEETKTQDLKIRSLRLQDNEKWGFYAKNCDLSLDQNKLNQLNITGSPIVIAGDGSDLAFNRVAISGGSTTGIELSGCNMKANQSTFTNNGNGLAADKSNVALYSCTFSGNTIGLHGTENESLAASRSKFNGNSDWGVAIHGPAGAGVSTFTGCVIQNNAANASNPAQSGGLYLEGVGPADLKLTDTTIADNGRYGMYASASTLVFDTNMIHPWRFSGHDCQIGSDQSHVTYSKFQVTGGRRYGVYATNGELHVKDSTFSGAAAGLYSRENNKFVATKSTFRDNTKYGVQIRGNATLDGCTIEGNESGILLQDVGAANQVTLADNTLSDNSKVGIYASNCTMTFDSTTFAGSTISGSKTLFAGHQSDLTFDSLTIEGGTQFGIASYDGKLTVTNSTFSGNKTGLYTEDSSACVATGSTFRNNTDGVRVRGPATFNSCLLEKNTNGLAIVNGSADDVKLATSRIINNTQYGVYAESSNLEFDSTMQADWVVEGNGSNFGATGSTMTFTGFTIKNGTTYGLVVTNGTATLTNSKLTGNDTGVYVDSSSTLTAANTQFTGNTTYGASLQGTANLSGCTFSKNRHGLQFANMSDGQFDCSNTTVSNNTQYGLHLESCTLTLTGNGVNGLTISDNAYGIHGSNSKLVFNGFTSTGNTYGALLTNSDITISNSTFTGSSVGLWANNNTSFKAVSSNFINNRSWGIYLVGPGSLRDCTVSNNRHGMVVSGVTLTDSNLIGTSITDNQWYGLYVVNGGVNLSTQATDQWSIARNGTNLMAYRSDLKLTSVTMEDAKTYGVYAWYGSLDLDRSTISSKSSGVLTYLASKVSVDRSHINGSGSNTGWGLINYLGALDVQNTVISGLRYGLYSYAPTKSANIRHTTIANAGSYGIYVRRGDANIANTIISGTGSGYGLWAHPGSNVLNSHNLISGFANPFYNTNTAGEVLQKPRFANAAAGDFSLGTGSPAINSGAVLSAAVNYDMDGNQRPLFKVFDIGAYEYTKSDGSFRVLDWQEKE
jgi:parallel beta-helix repeat protein